MALLLVLHVRVSQRFKERLKELERAGKSLEELEKSLNEPHDFFSQATLLVAQKNSNGLRTDSKHLLNFSKLQIKLQT